MSTNIMIVEDHNAVRATLRAWLSGALSGCSILEAEDGQEAIQLVREHSPCVVLMDLNMPGVGGIEATRSIKAASPATHVVIVSMHDTTAHRNDAAAAGASAYIAKDSMGFELLSVLTRLLPATSAARESAA